MKKAYSHGVGVLIIQDQKILLTHRIKGEQIGVWEVPAGHIKESETSEEAALREVREETGLQIKIIRKLGTNVDEDYAFKAEVFLAEVVSGKLQNLDTGNHSALKWFSLNELPNPLGSTAAKGLQELAIT